MYMYIISKVRTYANASVRNRKIRCEAKVNYLTNAHLRTRKLKVITSLGLTMMSETVVSAAASVAIFTFNGSTPGGGPSGNEQLHQSSCMRHEACRRHRHRHHCLDTHSRSTGPMLSYVQRSLCPADRGDGFRVTVGRFSDGKRLERRVSRPIHAMMVCSIWLCVELCLFEPNGCG